MPCIRPGDVTDGMIATQVGLRPSAIDETSAHTIKPPPPFVGGVCLGFADRVGNASTEHERPAKAFGLLDKACVLDEDGEVAVDEAQRRVQAGLSRHRALCHVDPTWLASRF